MQHGRQRIRVNAIMALFTVRKGENRTPIQVAFSNAAEQETTHARS